jgi:2-methylisocitrate lyase-like PEP mutase family enzyme
MSHMAVRPIDQPRSTRRQFREALTPGAALILPGVANALAARVVADAGFPAAYVTGAGIANSYLGIPDNGLVTLSELVDHVAAIREIFAGPLMVDADTGFGNALNMGRTIKFLERAGADAIQIEDQVFPKRCGHFEGKDVIPRAEMVAKIKAAVDARTDPDLMIVARTDAIAVEGFNAAIDRAHAFREAGADVGFVEAPTSAEQIETVARLPGPQLINIVIGGKTPEKTNDELKKLGFAGVLYANTALQAAVLGMQKALAHLKQHGRVGDAKDLLATFAERQRLVDIAAFQTLERKYKTDPQ